MTKWKIKELENQNVNEKTLEEAISNKNTKLQPYGTYRVTHEDKYYEKLRQGIEPYVKLDDQQGETHLRKYSDIRLPYTGKHYIEDCDLKIPKSDIQDRIFHRMDRFKVAMAYRSMNFIDKGLNYVQSEVLHELQAIDYSQKWEDASASFELDKSFTWIDWKRAEMITDETDLCFLDLQEDEQVRLMFNVFPMGATLLSMLAFNTKTGSVDGNEAVSQKADQSKDAEQMFSAAQEGYEVRL